MTAQGCSIGENGVRVSIRLRAEEQDRKHCSFSMLAELLGALPGRIATFPANPTSTGVLNPEQELLPRSSRHGRAYGVSCAVSAPIRPQRLGSR